MSDRDLPCTCGHLSGDHSPGEVEGQILGGVGYCLKRPGCQCSAWTAVEDQDVAELRGMLKVIDYLKYLATHPRVLPNHDADHWRRIVHGIVDDIRNS